VIDACSQLRRKQEHNGRTNKADTEECGQTNTIVTTNLHGSPFCIGCSDQSCHGNGNACSRCGIKNIIYIVSGKEHTITFLTENIRNGNFIDCTEHFYYGKTGCQNHRTVQKILFFLIRQNIASESYKSKDKSLDIAYFTEKLYTILAKKSSGDRRMTVPAIMILKLDRFNLNYALRTEST